MFFYLIQNKIHTSDKRGFCTAGLTGATASRSTTPLTGRATFPPMDPLRERLGGAAYTEHRRRDENLTYSEEQEGRVRLR